MSLRKDVYELLCLYEGTHPREGFKPTGSPPRDKIWSRDETGELVKLEIPWITEDPDNGRYLILRTQVPDRLEAAYDIAISEGLLEQYLLEPNRQMEVYRQNELPLPPQDKPWPVFLNNSDALVKITDKGRAAIALHSTDSEILSERIKVDLRRGASDIGWCCLRWHQKPSGITLAQGSG